MANNAFTLTYLQCEKIVWLIDTGVLVVSPDFDFKVKTAHKLFWSLSAFVGLIRLVIIVSNRKGSFSFA